jgi:DNA-binding transcriptional ArsR family regulator
MAEQHDVISGNAPLEAGLLEAVVETFKALSDPTRAQLVYLLTQGELSVNELCDYVDVTPSAVSHHLAKLRAIRLVRTRRAGNQVFYSVDDAHVALLFREALFHLDHVQRNLPDHPHPDHPHPDHPHPDHPHPDHPHPDHPHNASHIAPHVAHAARATQLTASEER